MSAQYKEFATKQAAIEAAEAVGLLYAQSISSAYPMPQVAHGPGLRPTPAESYFQRYWVAPLDAQVDDAQFGTKALPIRIEPDAFTLAQDGKRVSVNAKSVDLDFRNLKDADAKALGAEAMAAEKKAP